MMNSWELREMSNTFTNESYASLFIFLKELTSSFANEKLQKLALSHVPLQEIRKKVDLKIKELSTLKFDFDEEIIFWKELVLWFKNDFYHWMGIPSCDKCKIKMSFKEKINSLTRSFISTFVELYKCPKCGVCDFLNRFVEPRILLTTREGRCSEFALCFTLICLSLGFRARYVYDITDHCWTEVYSAKKHRWVHIDPSEGIVDNPLMYEIGWQKKLSYIFSFGILDLQDVTWRYSSNHSMILNRRSAAQSDFIITEIVKHRNSILRNVSKSEKYKEFLFVLEELGELLIQPIPKNVDSYIARQSGLEDMEREAKKK